MIRAAHEWTTGNSVVSPSKRALILKDSLTFLMLLSVTVALFGVTLLLFRSFEGHREELAKSWADRGRTELEQRHPEAAVASLRAALAYAPDDYASQLLLAQALADSGDTDQAINYFLNLWAARPGDGFLNLQLARLEAKRKNANPADVIAYYRASIFGDWRGDGSIKRRDVRLELVDYLMQQHEDAAARMELLVAAGNAPNNLHLEGMFAEKLLAAGDANDALAYYEKAIADNPHDAEALAGAGRIAYGQGDYAKARLLLARALADSPADSPRHEELGTQARDAGRLAELSLSRELPAGVRAEHLVTAARIAQERLASCPEGDESQELQTRWREASGGQLKALVADAEGQETLTALIFDTERRTAQTCGQPSGDDALLLKLANGREGQP